MGNAKIYAEMEFWISTLRNVMMEMTKAVMDAQCFVMLKIHLFARVELIL